LELKKKVWNKLAIELCFPMNKIVKTISLEEAPKIMQGMLAGKTSGRYLVKTFL
jgi:hypothetical protein